MFGPFEGDTVSPTVSVILPTFNRLPYLKDAVGSVLEQSFGRWELIVADDGSDAATRRFLAGLEAPPRIRVMWLSHSGRPSIVRNCALAEARGELVAFIDSDDLWLREKLQRQIESLRRHPARAWSYTRFDLVDEAGHPLPACRRSPVALSGWILRALLERETVIATPSVVVSRELLLRVGPFDEAFSMCEDDELWFRLATQSEIDGVDEPLTLVRRHGQHSGTDVEAWAERRRVFEKLLRASAGDPLEDLLRQLRAEMSAGLARSLANSGERLAALRTILGSLRHAWPFGAWWLGAFGTAARALSPPAVRRIARACRERRARHIATRREGALR